MSLEHILLGLLQAPHSGYELKAAFDQSISYFWPAELSQIYRTLRQLERRELLHSKPAPSQRGPQRRIYALTPAGRQQLLAWLTAEPRFGDERFTYLAQVFFMAAASDLRRTQQFVERMRAAFHERLAALRAIEKARRAAAAKDPQPEPDEEFHRLLTLRMGLHRNAASIRWCNETLRAIQTRRAQAARHKSRPKRR